MAEMGSTELLLSGRLGMLNNGSWAFNTFRDTDFTVGLGHYPKGPGGRSNYVYYYPLVVPKTTEHPECAFNLMKYFNGPAMEKIIKDGGLQGTSFEAQEKWFVTDPVQPNHKEVMLDSVKHFLAPDPILTNWSEILNVMQAQIDLLSIGEERDAQVVCDEIVRQVNPLIKEGQWRS
jgi:ABC-type glycerol-3-phosphate transport system substrate-binding protein